MRTLEFPLKALTFDTPAGVRASLPFQGSKINLLSEEKRNKASDAKLFVDQTASVCGGHDGTPKCSLFLLLIIFKWTKLGEERPESISL